MKKFVATGMSSEQVKEFINDFYELDSMWQNSVTITPERDKCIKEGISITFKITITPINEVIANYMEKYVINGANSLIHEQRLFRVIEE